MKLLNKLALATAVAALSTASFAMEAMTDSSMAATTGQDGISIAITPGPNGITIDKLLIHDNDGIAARADTAANTTAGAIVLGGPDSIGLSIQNSPITIDVDAAGNQADGATLQAAITLGDGLTDINIDIGDVFVGTSGDAAAVGQQSGAAQRGTVGTDLKILGGFGLTMGQTSIVAQLGNQTQGNFAQVKSTINGGISIDTLELVDADGIGGLDGAQGGLYVNNLKITDDASANLEVDLGIDVDGSEGIVITDNGTTSKYLYLTDFGISNGNGVVTNNTIGDIEIIGLNTVGSSIRINGK